MNSLSNLLYENRSKNLIENIQVEIFTTIWKYNKKIDEIQGKESATDPKINISW
jgi:hypothetical protein